MKILITLLSLSLSSVVLADADIVKALENDSYICFAENNSRYTNATSPFCLKKTTEDEKQKLALEIEILKLQRDALQAPVQNKKK